MGRMVGSMVKIWLMVAGFMVMKTWLMVGIVCIFFNIVNVTVMG